jgi:prophage DNA circulation protein
MSLDQLTGGVRSLSNVVSSGQNAANRLASDVGAGGGKAAASWREKLRPASFRGVAFGVLEGQLRFGRRVAIHEYPFRDTVWVEDLGKLGRRVAFNGFLVGDDCIAQRDLLIKACEDAGAAEGGELVHPTLGRMRVSLADAVTCIERWDRGRVFEIGFSFVEQGKRIFPNSSVDTRGAVQSAAAKAKTAASANLLSTVAGALKSGLAVAAQAASTVASWAAAAQRLVNDATNLYHFVQGLPGEFGRLFGGNSVRSPSASTSVQSLVALGAVGRANVAVASGALGNGAAGLASVVGDAPSAGGAGTGLAGSPGGVAGPVSIAVAAYAESAHGLAGAVAAAAPSPSDALRLLSSLIDAAPALPGNLVAPAYPITPVFPTPSAQAVALMAGASSDLFRRAAVIALAQAASGYQPTSHDDAAAVRIQVTGRLDAEIAIAGDQGQDETYNALRDLRTAVVQDLTARGTSLAALVVVSTPLSLPAPVLAQRLYRDAGRADELVAEANPIHPAFMPTTFKALGQ